MSLQKNFGRLFVPLVLLGVTNAFAIGTTQGAPAFPQWADTVSLAPSVSDFFSVASDSKGDVYAVGLVSGMGVYDFGSGIQTRGTSSASNPVLVKYDRSGVAQWVRLMRGASTGSVFADITNDRAGNIYVVGVAAGGETYDFGNDVTIKGSPSYHSPLIVKYDSTGVAQWANTLETGSGGDFYGVTIDDAGNLYAVGILNGIATANFGNGVTATGQSTNGTAVLVKYNSAGVARWAQAVTGEPNVASYCHYRKVASDKAGNIYVVGSVTGASETYSLGNGVTAQGLSPKGNAILVKYDSGGVAQWAQVSMRTLYMKVACDNTGKIYIVGDIVGENPNSKDNKVKALAKNLIAKYDSSGRVEWLEKVDTDPLGAGSFIGVTVDSAGNPYAIGLISSYANFNFGNGVTTRGAYNHLPGFNAVMVKFDSTGTALWAWTPIRAPSNSGFGGVSSDDAGNIYTVGDIEGSGTFDLGGGISVKGSYALAPSLWSRFIGPHGDDRNAVVVKFTPE